MTFITNCINLKKKSEFILEYPSFHTHLIITLLKLLPLSAILFACPFGCFDESHDFRIQFGDVYGLRKGDLVYLEEAATGKVVAVEHTGSGDFIVSVSIQKEFTSE